MIAPNTAFSGYEHYYGGTYDVKTPANYAWSSYQIPQHAVPTPYDASTQIDTSATFQYASGGMSISHEEEEDFTNDYVTRRAGKQKPRGYESRSKNDKNKFGSNRVTHDWHICAEQTQQAVQDYVMQQAYWMHQSQLEGDPAQQQQYANFLYHRRSQRNRT